MEADQQERKIIESALQQWEQEGLLSPEQAEKLRGSIRTGNDTRKQLSQYLFIVAISCSLLAFGAIFIDEKILEALRRHFALSNAVIALVCAAAGLAWWWRIRKKRDQYSVIAFEFYALLGALAMLSAWVYVCKDLGPGEAYSGLLFGASLLLAAGTLWLRSQALWIATLLALMGWYGAFSTAFSVRERFLGMNYPVRFTIFGLLVLSFSWLQERIRPLVFCRYSTYLTGLMIFFTGFWGTSIFGNYSSFAEWEKVRQTQVLIYAFLFAAAAVAAFLWGLKKEDAAARDFGLLFLLLNLYTRYFEYFWGTMNKGLFFLVLAVSFWLIGRWVEKGRKHNFR